MHSHSHSGPVDLAPEDRRRVVYVLAGIVIPLAAITLIALAMLWPRGQTPVGTLPVNAAGTDRVTGPITSIGQADENGQTPVKMRVKGVEVPVHVPPEIVANGLSVGDEIQALFNPNSLESGVAYIFVDFVRTGPMVLLLIIYVVAVALVARFKGLMALVGLGVSLGVVGAFMIPALTVSGRPVLVILVASAAMMFASIYLAHGVSIRTTTAVLGTFSGLVITTLLAWWAVGAANLTGALSDESRLLAGNLPSVNLQALLLGGMILAGLGALNDVTITQVSTVWELHSANPRLPRRRLFTQGMTVGRDHIASTVYTLAFAYVGTAIALLMGASLYQRPAINLLQLGEIAEEIIRTLVASIGLVLAIPLTTAIAAALAPVAPGALAAAGGGAGDGEPARAGRRRGARGAAGAGGAEGRRGAGDGHDGAGHERGHDADYAHDGHGVGHEHGHDADYVHSAHGGHDAEGWQDADYGHGHSGRGAYAGAEQGRAGGEDLRGGFDQAPADFDQVISGRAQSQLDYGSGPGDFAQAHSADVDHNRARPAGASLLEQRQGELEAEQRSFSEASARRSRRPRRQDPGPEGPADATG